LSRKRGSSSQKLRGIICISILLPSVLLWVVEANMKGDRSRARFLHAKSSISLLRPGTSQNQSLTSRVRWLNSFFRPPCATAPRLPPPLLVMHAHALAQKFVLRPVCPRTCFAAVNCCLATPAVTQFASRGRGRPALPTTLRTRRAFVRSGLAGGAISLGIYPGKCIAEVARHRIHHPTATRISLCTASFAPTMKRHSVGEVCASCWEKCLDEVQRTLGSSRNNILPQSGKHCFLNFPLRVYRTHLSCHSVRTSI
jgi:hypothetical protein